MSFLKKIVTWFVALPLMAVFTQCAIVDDIPFPFMDSDITAFEVEGQCDASGRGIGSAQIDNNKRIVQIYVSDTVDITRLRVTRFEVSNKATIDSREAACLHPDEFPTESFSETSHPENTRIDFTHEAQFTLHTYQDYKWVVRVTQVVNRKISVRGQVGEAVIDPVNRNAVVYVTTSEDLHKIRVNEFSLGGDHGAVSPDPTIEDNYDFSSPRTFNVTYGWSDKVHEWKVFVYETDEIIGTTATVFPRTTSAYVSGEMQNGTIPVIDYRKQGTEEWSTVAYEELVLGTAKYSADIHGLTPGETYECKVTAGESSTSIITFTTYPALQLENAGFDDWHTSGSGNQVLYMPWAEGGTCYWDTGNRGATTVGASNSTVVTEDGRTFANLQSKYIVIKFAAGNIFTGEYVETDGSNGVLGFGRPFTAFPIALQFDYRYKSSTITRTGGNWNNAYGNYISQQMYENLKGQPDSCQIYVALLDDYLDDADREANTYKGTAYPWLIRTRPSALHLFDANSKRVIAYAQLTQGQDVSAWKTEKLTLTYRDNSRTPKYIMVVASSSKYGDYFTGGEQSLLQLDNLKLLYE